MFRSGPRIALPLTRRRRYAPSPTSPRKARGEVEKKSPHQPLDRLHRGAVGEHRFRQHPFGEAEMIVQYALDDRAQIGGRRKIATLLEPDGLQPPPVRNPPAALR